MFGMMEALLSFIRRQVGLRTDQASATGSLHAKVGEARNSTLADTLAIKNLIGVASHTRANNTVMGWLNSSIKSIQKGTVLVDSFEGKSITISTVNMQKTMVVISGITLLGSHTSYLGARIELESSTTLKAYRSYDGSDCYITYCVVEFY